MIPPWWRYRHRYYHGRGFINSCCHWYVWICFFVLRTFVLFDCGAVLIFDFDFCRGDCFVEKTFFLVLDVFEFWIILRSNVLVCLSFRLPQTFWNALMRHKIGPTHKVKSNSKPKAKKGLCVCWLWVCVDFDFVLTLTSIDLLWLWS